MAWRSLHISRPARLSLVGAGFLPVIGLHHASVGNAFNLADDLVEPLRPVVDLVALRLGAAPSSDDLTLDHRRALAGVLTESIRLDGAIVNLLIAAEQMAETLSRALELNSAALLQLPGLVPRPIPQNDED